MAKKPKPPDDPEQYARFLEAAKKAEASDDPKALEEALRSITAKRASSGASSAAAGVAKKRPPAKS